MPGTGSTMVKIVMYGDMGSTQTWSTGAYFAPPVAATPFDATDLNTLATECLDAANSFFGPIRTYEATYCSLIGIRCYSYGPASSAAVAVGEATLGTPPVGTSGSPNIPYVAAACSLLSEISGRSTRGRMYVPATGATSLDATGQFGTTFTGLVANGLATYLSACAGHTHTVEPATVYVPVIASFTTAKVTPVTSLRCDTKPDTQRRREDKIGASGESVAPYPPA